MRRSSAVQIFSLAVLLILSICSCPVIAEEDVKKTDTIPPPRFYPASSQESSAIFDKQDVEYPFTFIVYGDSREPSSKARLAIIDRIIKEKPLFVIQLGDMVTYGETAQWKIFDNYEKKIIDASIPFYPVLGNHEYYTSAKGYPYDPKEQLWHYFKRFKFLENRRWYSFRYGNSLFIMLDTNTDYSKGSLQYKWFIDRLNERQSGFLFIAMHHPPYTKNKIKSLRKSERFLAGILEGDGKVNLPKADIVFSSHTHNYERYRYGGVNYVVSGGAGAPQYPVARDKDDFYTEKGDTYHYCKVTVSKKSLLFEMFKLTGTNSWKIADSFTISG